MKDSQLVDCALFCAVKYIKANNERFSTGSQVIDEPLQVYQGE